MGTKHPHYDVIVAWAAGEEIEFWSDVSEAWETLGTFYVPPAFYEDYKYRIKPKRVKKEGWVNVYSPTVPCIIGVTGDVHRTKEEAEFCKSGPTVACIRIEWEEEE